MINNVVLIGRLTRDPELRYTPSNVAVATFNLAVNRNFKGTNGEREADFINCIMWRQQAENFANWLKKGALVGITGRIQTRSYENQHGQRVYVTEVVAESFQTLEKKDNTANQSSMENQMPPNYGQGEPMDISDDDLPFQCEVRNMVGVTYQEIHLFVEFLKERYGQGRPDYIEALNDLDGLVEVSYREAIERFLEDEVR